MADKYYYEYEDAGEYCYPSTLVLVNKLNIKQTYELYEAERRITALSIIQILDEPIKGVFNFEHLLAIHKAIFADIYAWAGKVRTVNISKGNRFCDTGYIETYAKKLFDELKCEAYLTNVPPKQIAQRLAYYLGEINILHPFREGNGRTQRVIIEYIAKVAGYDLNFATITGKEMVAASVEAFNGNYVSLANIFGRIITPIQQDEQADFVNRLTAKRGPVYLAWHKKNLHI